MNSTELILFLEEPETVRSAWGTEYVDTHLATSPAEYIRYANSDLESSLEQKYINALANAKRALDGQADRLMKLLGVKQNGKTIGFPLKLEYIKKVDIIAPRVLNKINRVRNQVEHEYQKPDPNEVEDFVDIVSLFVEATERYASYTLVSVSYDCEYSERFGIDYHITIDIDNLNSQLKIKVDRHKFGWTPNNFIVKIDNPDYFNILKFHFKKAEYR